MNRTRFLGACGFFLFLLAFSANGLAAAGTITCGASDTICQVSGDFTSSVVFIDGNTYVITAATTFKNPGVDLNIQPGAVVKYKSGATISITASNSARINADGNANIPGGKYIIFTMCRDQTVGANTSAISGCSGAIAFGGIAISLGSDARVPDTNAFSYLSFSYMKTGIRLDQPIKSIRDSNFSHMISTASTVRVGIYLFSSVDTNIYNNYFSDINGSGTLAGVYAAGIDLGSADSYSGSIYNNYFSDIRRGGNGILLEGSSNLNGYIHDNNFDVNLSNATATPYAIYNGGVTVSGDINNNQYRTIGQAASGYIANYFYYETGDPLPTHTGSICNNTVHDSNFTTFIYANVTDFTGQICGNIFRDMNASSMVELANTPAFSGGIHDNNFMRVQRDTNAVRLVNATTFSGNIYNNRFTDVNISTGSAFYGINIAGGSTFSGGIYNNVFKDINSNAAIYPININGSIFSGDIYNNSFMDINSSSSSTVSGIYYSASSAFPFQGSIYSNNFSRFKFNSGAPILFSSGTVSGDVHDNNFLNIDGGSSGRVFTNGGTFSGDFFHNTIYNADIYGGVWVSDGTFTGDIHDNNFDTFPDPTFTGVIYTGGTSFNGGIYNNRFKATAPNGGSIIFIYNTSSNTLLSDTLRVYNNLFLGSHVGSGLVTAILNEITMAGSVYNNTFVGCDGSIGCDTGTITASVQNNLFAYNSDAPGSLSGTVSNNAYYNNGTISGSASQHVGDQNSGTGFTTDPFIGGNSDRNFLLNTTATGGAKLVNAGTADSNSVTPANFFVLKTTQANNRLDRGTIDIGYHYDQNAPFATVVSPNGGEVNWNGTRNIDFNLESGYGTASGLTASFNYSGSPSGGTPITSHTLSAYSCSSGPFFVCSYAWDSSDVPDGNYFIILTGTDSNGSATDSSDANFSVRMTPRVFLKTFLLATNKPRSFFGSGQDVNIIVDGNTPGLPHITITDSDGNIRVNDVNLNNQSVAGDTNRYQYTYKLDGNNGWYDVKISGRTYAKAFYQSRFWQSGFSDASGNIFPFRFDLNVQEPGMGPRWFALVDAPVDFNYQTNASAVRVLDYNGDSYLEIPSQLHDASGSGNSVTHGTITFLVSLDRGETRNFFVNYMKAQRDANYGPDLNVVVSDSNYLFENSRGKTEIDLNLGGMVSRIWNKTGSNSSLAGYVPMQLSPEIMASGDQYRASALANPDYSLDANGSLFSRLNVRGIRGIFDYNLTYYFYAKQPWFLVDMNVKPLLAQTWNYLYDDQLRILDGGFNKFGYYANNSLNSADVISGNGSDIASAGDINYWGAYKTGTADGIGTIFLYRFSSPAPSISTTFYDESLYEYWTHQVYSGSVATSQSFNTRIARSIFNGWAGASDLNQQFFEFNNPLIIRTGGTATSDSTPPIFLSTGYTPTDTNDAADLNIWATAGDDLQIDYVDINILGPDVNIHTRQTFSDANATPNYTIDKNSLNAGTLDVNFRAYDLTGNNDLNSRAIVVSDKTAPIAWNVSQSPDDNFSIDPGTSLIFDVNTTEYSSISAANLLVRWYYDENSTWSDWNSIPLNFVNRPSDYNYNYDLNYSIPTDLNKRFQYKVSTLDSAGNDANTTTRTFFAYWDYNWTLTPGAFTTVSATLDTNVFAGQLAIQSNSDIDLNFKITTNWSPSDQAYADGNAVGLGGYTTADISPGQSITLDMNVTTKLLESQDTFIVTVTPENSLAIPASQAASGTVISLAGGPFMYVAIQAYPVTVVQGDSNQFIARVTNKGNQAANGVDLNWTFPSGWSVTTGSASAARLTLAVDSAFTNTVTVLIPSDATTGIQTITATADCDGNASKTRSVSASVTVVSASSSGTETPGGTTVVINSGGGASGTGGGSGSSIFKDPEQAKAFFTTSKETFELLRGKNATFSISIQNPFEKDTLQEVHVSVSGLLAKYLKLSQTELGNIAPKEEKKLTIQITAPNYFTSGEHQLLFTIEGTIPVKQGNETINRAFKEERTVTLVIREVDEKGALALIQQNRETIEAMKQKGWETEKLVALQQKAQELLAAKKYEEIPALAEQIQQLYALADSVSTKTAELEAQLQQAKDNGLDAPKTARMVELAKLAFSRGDYESASKQIEDAGTIYLLETKGAFNLTFFAVHHWKPISAAGIIIIVVLFFGSLFARHAWLTQRIKGAQKEEGLILNLIKSAQDQCFVEKKISMSEYYDTITHFERKLSKTVEKGIALENKRANLFKFKSEITRLSDEKQNLLGNIKKTQEDYFTKGIIETRIYQAKTRSLMERYTQVEKNIVLNETVKSLRMENSRIKPLWKMYYTVFK